MTDQFPSSLRPALAEIQAEVARFGERLDDLRRQAGVSPVEAARRLASLRLDVAPGLIGRADWERLGRHGVPEAVPLIALLHETNDLIASTASSLPQEPGVRVVRRAVETLRQRQAVIEQLMDISVGKLQRLVSPRS